MVGTVWLEERLLVCERLLCGGGFAPPTQEVGCGGMSLTSLCAFWCCPDCAVLAALFVDLVVGQNFLESECP